MAAGAEKWARQRWRWRWQMQLAAWASAGAVAAPAGALPGALRSSAQVEARVTSTTTSAVEAPGPAADDPDRLGPDRLVESRVRAGGELRWDLGGVWLQGLSLALQADALHAPLSYHTTAWARSRIAADPLLGGDRGPLDGASLRLRQLSLKADGRFFRLEAGRMVSRWGLGLLAQSGDDEPFQFGLKRHGNVVDRAQLALLPAAIPGDGTWLAVLPLALVIAADRVVRDDLADRALDEDARQIVGAVALRWPGLELGVYGVRRWQRDAAGLGLQVWAGDAYAAWQGKVGPLRASIATEWVLIQGDTDYFRTASSPARLDVRQHGGLLRARLQGRHVGLQLDAGLASGDERPFDDAITNFKFAHDNRVGIVLFGEQWRRQSAGIVANLGDPRYTGQAPAGAERFASDGAATGARWLAPTLRLQHGALTILGGLLFAQGTSRLVDPHRTGLAGGAPTGPRGGAASDDLGWEVDAAAAWDQPLVAGLRLRARLDVGVAFPGAAFDDAQGAPAAAVGAAIGQVALHGTW